ncbi:hypothetical protein GCM10022281_00620 [Sphingomonas rosea]|uniref:DUF308 domain-containing protein n=1 Tax=Sphingomonas rosea TaxID=335605 RepID=A0ABP7TH15_9SPHN
MTDFASRPPRFALHPLRLLGWGALALLLALPAILRFPWSGGDFVIMGVMLASVGLGIEFLSRRSGNGLVLLGSILGVLTTFLTVWVNLAVGMIASEDNPYNQLFLLPIAIFIGGCFVTRLRASQMTGILLLAGAAQFFLGLGGLGTDQRGAIFSMGFALFWLFGAALFRAGSSR